MSCTQASDSYFEIVWYNVEHPLHHKLETADVASRHRIPAQSATPGRTTSDHSARISNSNQHRNVAATVELPLHWFP